LFAVLIVVLARVFVGLEVGLTAVFSVDVAGAIRLVATAAAATTAATAATAAAPAESARSKEQ